MARHSLMRAAMNASRSLIALVLLVGACTDHDVVDRAGCTRLRDHVVDLRVADAAGELGGDVAQHRRAMKQALGEDFIANCVQAMSYEQLACSLKLTNLADSGQCVGPTVSR
jgi:hypothetical protein